jgi:AcrR family transcriptional regulator
MTQETRLRLTAEERRTAILTAARHVFAKHGFHGAGTAEIAREAGCSEPMLYKHFPSKQALFAATLDDASLCLRARIHAMFDEGKGELESIVAWVEKLEHDDMILEVSRLRMLGITLADDPEIRAALDRSVAEMRRRVTGIFTRLQEQGQARTDVDAEQLGWLWLGFVLAAGFRFAVEGEQALPEIPKLPKTLITLMTNQASEEV